MKKTILYFFLLFSISLFSQFQPVYSPIASCSYTNDGHASFDLNSRIPEILANVNPSEYSVMFYTTIADAETGANAILYPSNYYNLTPNSQEIFIGIRNLTTNEISVASMLLVVQAGPIILQNTYSSCLEQGLASFNLSIAANQIYQYNNSNPNTMMVSFHLNGNDAGMNTNPLPYFYTTAAQVTDMFVRVTNIETGCFTIGVIILVGQDCNGAPCNAPTNVMTTNITTTSATITWNSQIPASTWEVYVAPSGTEAPTENTTGFLSSTNPFTVTGLTCNTAVSVYVRTNCGTSTSTWTGPYLFQTLPCASVISVNNSYSTSQLINSILLNEECASGVDVITQGDCGIAYFNKNTSNFPFEEGMIIRSGIAAYSVGPYTGANYDSSTCSQLGDTDLTAIMTGMNQTGSINDVSSVKFNFTATSNLLTFNFVFASNEYGEFQCAYSDVFGFILTDLTTGIKQNIAVVPGTNIPISTTTIRNNIYNGSCTSMNEAFFGQFNVNDINSAINFKGQTVPMTAFATLIPNREYSLKLAVGDYQDTAYDSAVFIEGGSLAFGNQCQETIQLIAFVDENNNGIKDANEVNYNQGTYTYTINGATETVDNQSSNGVFILFPEDLAAVYTFDFSVFPELGAYFSSATNYINIVYDANGANIFYFPVQNTQPYNDVQVSVAPIQGPNPGFNYFNAISYKNLGITPASGLLSYTKDSVLTIISNSQADATPTANGFTYNYTNLLPNETRTIVVGLSVPPIPIVALGQPVTNTANSTNTGDINLENNTSVITQNISGSYDPNDKMESHGGKIIHANFNVNDYLYYTIRFQNSGTANAQFIRIEDVLDNRLDETSLRMVNASHNYVLTREGNLLEWKFNQINLPPSIVNEIESNGFVTFKIKVKPGFAIGDIISNTANIFFDYNPAIVTNTFTTEFVQVLSNTTFTDENVAVYPNPASTMVTIALNNATENIQSIDVYSMLGKKVVELNNITSNQATLNTSSLAKGVYLVEINSNTNGKLVKKLVIQ